MKSSMKLQYAESFQMQMPSVFVCMYNLVEVNKKITQILTASLKQSLPFVCWYLWSIFETKCWFCLIFLSYKEVTEHSEILLENDNDCM